ncbi:CBS domain-containing protein [Caldimonas sp. KR1-144]|uniref:CBS domain-containing protein n=1 Tax=Caldimonas sp. KR1-144 TaxID=3400911 RepID=UPI003BFFA8E9
MKDRTTAGDVCSRNIAIVYRSTAVGEAARLMRERHVGCLPVVEDAGATGESVVVGMLTDRDIVTAAVAKDIAMHGLSVGEVMSRDLVSVREEDSLLDALATMRRKGVRRLPVTAAQGRLVGLLVADDLLQAMAAEMGSLLEAMSAQGRHEQVQRP